MKEPRRPTSGHWRGDTVYFWVNLDVTEGPLVVETTPLSLGVIDDIWFRWATGFGLPGQRNPSAGEK